MCEGLTRTLPALKESLKLGVAKTEGKVKKKKGKGVDTPTKMCPGPVQEVCTETD